MAAAVRPLSKYLLQSTAHHKTFRDFQPTAPSLQFHTISAAATDHQRNTKPERFIIKKANGHASSSSLVLLYGFFNASESALSKYCNLYHQRGYDVLCLPSHLNHFAWPKNSVVLANDVLNYLDSFCNSYENIIVHAFSMGAYNFTVCFGTMYERPEKFAGIQNRIRCVVYDSLTIGDLSNMVYGVAQGLSKNILMRKLIPLTAWIYFGATHKQTVQFYDHYVDIFKTKPLPIPTLFFSCRNDPMSRQDVIEEMVAMWRSRCSFPVTLKSWDKSKHCAHLVTHEQEYVSSLFNFLNKVPALNKTSKL